MRSIVCALALTVAVSRPALATEFLVHPGGQSRVVFFSSTTTEKFQGKTNRLGGRIVVDPTALGDSATVHLEVEVGSFDTGVAKRDQHMRENHFEVGKYPLAIFDGATLIHSPGMALTDGQPVEFDSEGTFTLHGVSRRLRVHVAATFQPDKDGGSIAFSTRFPVKLSDYQITPPHFLFLKMSDTQDVRVLGIGTVSPSAGRYPPN